MNGYQQLMATSVTENKYNLKPFQINDYKFIDALGDGVLKHLTDTIHFPLKIGFVLKCLFYRAEIKGRRVIPDPTVRIEATFPKDRTVMNTVLSREDLNNVVK